MARLRSGVLHVGIKDHVIAVDRATGAEVWRTKLAGVRMRTHEFVHLHRDDDALFATYSGEVFCLDPKTGEVRWHNQLTGLGTGIVTMATESPAGSGAAAAISRTKAERDAQAAAAAT